MSTATDTDTNTPTPLFSSAASEPPLGGPADDYSDILDINNPPKLSPKLYKILAKHNISADDIELGEHKPELQPFIEYIIDGIQNHTLNITNNEHTLQSMNDDENNELDDDSIEAELGYTLDGNTPSTLYKVGLPVDKLECQFCKKQSEFLYNVRKAKRSNTTYAVDIESSDLADNLLIHYSNVELLYSYLNERGMITPRHTNGNCAKHQRKLANEIKRARYIGLLSYVTKFKVDESYVESVYGTSLQRSVAEIKNQEYQQLSTAQREKKKMEDDELAQFPLV